MNIRIRQEQEKDAPAVYEVIRNAFAKVEESDHQEHHLVERLHRFPSFVPSLSLVAETDDRQTVGYILLTEVEIVSGGNAVTSLGVAPLAVLPEFQQQGVGGLLLQAAHQRAAALGYGSAVLLGHPAYYPRFGYRKAIDFGIEFPFDVPCECCMVIELRPDALAGVRGAVRYPDAFGE